MRQDYNIEICNKLLEFFKKPENKDIRFHQGLSILDLYEYIIKDGVTDGIKDNFSEESIKTLNKLK